MWDKLKNDKYVKDMFVKLISVLIVAVIALLLFDVMTQSKDGRRQIVDSDGGTEYTEFDETSLETNEEMRLEQILSQIKGVGASNVMITYQDDENTTTVFGGENRNNNPRVEGVIVTAEGAGNIIVKSNIINAVAALYNIPATSVMVFEKSNVNN